MRSVRLRVALWFAASIAAVMAVFIAATFLHLRRELALEKWEHAPAGGNGFTLHGNYADPEVADIVNELWSVSLLYAAPILALAMAAGYFVARRALRPVEEMNRQLQHIKATTLSARVDVADAGREFEEIQHNINNLLVRLENSFQQLAEFSAQVAHELRTPLTLMRLQIEESAGRIEPALAESMQDELNRLADYVEQCLLLATAEQGRLSVRHERVALGALVSDVVEAYALLAREEQREIVQAITETDVVTDPRHLKQLLHVLLSNALRHGESVIHVRVGHDADDVPVCEVANRIATHRPAAAGNGLGLRVGRALAGALQIDWETRSESDQTFRATLRFRPVAPRAAARPATAPTLAVT